MLSMWLAVGCTDAQPCVDLQCPAVEGVYALQYEAPTNQTDGCASVPAADVPTTIMISRETSIARSTIDGVPIAGQIYDTYDISMTGTAAALDGGTLSVGFRAKYVDATRKDGGGADATLRGTLSLSVSQGGADCSADHLFTGGRL